MEKTFNRPSKHAPLRLAALLLFIVIPGLPAVAQDAFTSNVKPILTVSRSQGEIVIDGEINDAGWKQAAVADGLSETNPGDNTRPEVESKVLLTYDDNHLYMLLIAQDDPSSIRATLAERDNIWQDDYFGIIVDTYGDRAWAYELFVNPFGVQGDLRWTNNGEDMSFDIVWHSAGQITDSGWQVEVSIPFQSLRFPNRPEQEWAATFWRNRPRDSRYRYSWAAIDRDEPCWLCNFGTIKGISSVEPAGKLELLPSAIAFQSGSVLDDDDADAGFDNGSIDGDLSIGAKYSISSDLVAEGTLNPDFSQVESDAAQIDVNSTFALFFPERRPFFQEGSDLFNTLVNVVYTRAINDPRVAGKIYGRLNRTSVAFIGAYDENTFALIPGSDRSYGAALDESFVSIGRVKHTILDDSHLGMTITDRRHQGGGSGSLVSGEGSFRFLKNYSIEFQGVASYTDEPGDGYIEEDDEGNPIRFDDGRKTYSFDNESFWGHSEHASLEYNSRSFSWDLDLRQFSPTFRTNSGFVTRNAYRYANFWSAWDIRSDDNPLFDRVQAFAEAGRIWAWDGAFKDEWLRPRLWGQFPAQTSAEVSLLFSRERFRDTLITGIRRVSFNVDSRFSKPVSAGFWVNTGHSLVRFLEVPILGQTMEFEIWSRMKLTGRFTVEPSIRLFKADFLGDVNTTLFTDPVITPGQNIVETWVARTRLNYQFNRQLNARLIVEYFDEKNSYDPDDSRRWLSLEPLLTYEINPYTIFYIGSTHSYKDFDYSGVTYVRRHSQQFFAKLQYLFRP